MGVECRPIHYVASDRAEVLVEDAFADPASRRPEEVIAEDGVYAVDTVGRVDADCALRRGVGVGTFPVDVGVRAVDPVQDAVAGIDAIVYQSTAVAVCVRGAYVAEGHVQRGRFAVFVSVDAGFVRVLRGAIDLMAVRVKRELSIEATYAAAERSLGAVWVRVTDVVSRVLRFVFGVDDVSLCYGFDVDGVPFVTGFGLGAAVFRVACIAGEFDFACVAQSERHGGRTVNFLCMVIDARYWDVVGRSRVGAWIDLLALFPFRVEVYRALYFEAIPFSNVFARGSVIARNHR